MIELDFLSLGLRSASLEGCTLWKKHEQQVQRACLMYPPYACMIGFQAVHGSAAVMLLLCTKPVRDTPAQVTDETATSYTSFGKCWTNSIPCYAPYGPGQRIMC